MSDEALHAEVNRLRAEVESFRERELAELRSALAASRMEAAHYRNEAERNAAIGRQIAAEYQAQIADLRGQLSAVTKAEAHARRFGA